SSFFEVSDVVNIGGTLVSGQSQENLEGSIVQLVVSKADLTLFRIELNSYQECAALLSKLKINGALGHMDWDYVDGFLFLTTDSDKIDTVLDLVTQSTFTTENLCQLSLVGTGLADAHEVLQKLYELVDDSDFKINMSR